MVGVRAFHVIGRSGVLSRKAVPPVRTRPSGRGQDPEACRLHTGAWTSESVFPKSDKSGSSVFQVPPDGFSAGKFSVHKVTQLAGVIQACDGQSKGNSKWGMS